jgi:hypothetical protein
MTVATVPFNTVELIRLLQTDLASMDDVIRAAVPTVRVLPGSNSARAWALFCYRVYAPAPDADIDPVVVGVNFSHPDPSGAISVSGDIAGETLGDVLSDVPPVRATNRHAAEEAAHDVIAKLRGRADEVIRALNDGSRRT